MTITEGAITFSPYEVPKSLTDLAGKTVTVGTIVIDDDLAKANDEAKKQLKK